MKSTMRVIKTIFASLVLGGVSTAGLTLLGALVIPEPQIGDLFERWWLVAVLALAVCWFPLVQRKLK
jgi:branched-subunit amino acid ABC-type transport system permease component